MKRQTVATTAGALTLAMLVALTTGCNEKPVAFGREPTPTTPPAQPAREVTASGSNEVKVGQEFTFTLQSNRTTGYQWELAEPLDEKVVKLVRTEYKGSEAKTGVVGAGGVEVWTVPS